MKTRNLFLSLFAFAALCACNKEAQPEVPQILDADTYVKVNIMATGASTRAYEYGNSDENEVHNVLFLFYGTAEQPVQSEMTEWTTQPTGSNIAKSATVKFKAQTEKPTSMLVILNYDEAKVNDYKTASLIQVKAMLADAFFIKPSSTTYYTMTNSVYVDGTKVICEVPLTDANFGKTDTNGATTDVEPVNTYVERVAAKVVLTNNIDPAIDVTSSKIYINGNATPTTVTPVVVGYDVVNTPNQSYLIKNVDADWTYPDWSLPSNFRSFWAKTCDLISSNYINKTYSEIVPNNNPIYVFENTSESKTKVMLTAKLTVPDGSFGAPEDGNDDPDVVDLVKYSGKYYTLDGFANEAKNIINETFSTDISAIALEAVPHNNNYEMYLKLPTSHGLESSLATSINEKLATMISSYWNQGRCYYFTEIIHDVKESSTPGADYLAGVVRNHVYKISLNTLAGLGIPVSDEGTETIIPKETDGEYYSLNATINILQWKVVSQGVDFNN